MRRFKLVRDMDVTGVSGTGVIAEGVEFSDGTVVLRWFANKSGLGRSTAVWANQADMLSVHGYNGGTRMEYLDA